MIAMNFRRALIALVTVWAGVFASASVISVSSVAATSVSSVSSVAASSASSVAAASVSSMAPQAASGVPQAPKSVWDGVFTEEQAKRGEEEYLKNCAECHQAEMAGDGFAPALAGSDFMNAWNGLTVGDLYDRIRISMPPGKENSVSSQQKIDIVAHILRFNKFPAGTTELAPQLETAKQIKLEATKPGY
jgi:mono/diheme cytochrome c family protein